MFLRRHQTNRRLPTLFTISYTKSTIATRNTIMPRTAAASSSTTANFVPSSPSASSSSSSSCCCAWTHKMFHNCKYSFVNALNLFNSCGSCGTVIVTEKSKRNKWKHMCKSISGKSSKRYFTTATTRSSNYQDDTSSNNTNKKKKKRLISFITDIEGDASYFDRFVEKSRILDFEPVEPSLASDGADDSCNYKRGRNNLDFFPYNKQVVFRKDVHYENDNELPILVCGGDMWDKGGADLYVTRQLLSLQKRYGDDRVHFILGNRDINKMRIIQELGLDSVDEGIEDGININSLATNSLPFHGGVYWLRGSGLVGDTELIEKAQEYTVSSSSSGNNNDDIPPEYVEAMVPSLSAADRLKWMLKKTMGSPDAFELRRSELKQEMMFCSKYSSSKKESDDHDRTDELLGHDEDNEENDHKEISDGDVVASYKISTHPVHGEMGSYLAKGKLAILLGSAM